VIAGRQAGYGYRYNAERDGYDVHESEMTVVRRIFRKIGEGVSVHGVRAQLEDVRIPPPRVVSGSSPGACFAAPSVAVRSWPRRLVREQKGRGGFSSTTSAQHGARPASTPARSRDP
jgi:hypothetical protein